MTEPTQTTPTTTPMAAEAPLALHGACGADAVRCMTLCGPGKQRFAFPADGVAFSSRFDGGNMSHVQRVSRDEFHVTLAEDAAATPSGISTGYTSWFYFEVLIDSEAVVAGETGTQPRELRLMLTNMNHQRGLYGNGYTVMHCVMDAGEDTINSDGIEDDATTSESVTAVFDDERQWSRLPTAISCTKYTLPPQYSAAEMETVCAQAEGSGTGTGTDNDADRSHARKPEIKMRVAFRHRVRFQRERVRFAFCYPYTYGKLERVLTTMDRVRGVTNSLGVDQAAAFYYHREVLTYSLEGLPIHLLTISSHDHALPDTSQQGTDPWDCPASGLFPHSHGKQTARSFDPAHKRSVWLTARVHPGETPANFLLDGMLRLLLHGQDHAACALRRQFVFHIIPMLNPDGVAQGFYRTDSRGVNLNRVYAAPRSNEEPAVYALRALLLRCVDRHGGREQAQNRVVFLDLHAHANHRGCFVYGNNMGANSDQHRQVETQMFAKLMALHSPFFDYAACSFAADNMTKHDARDNRNAPTSRAGSSRVALFQATDLTFVYTLEGNYNEGRQNSASKVVGREPPTLMQALSGGQYECNQIERYHRPCGHHDRLFVKLSPLEWSDVGVGSLLALLDIFQLPGSLESVVTASPYRSLDGIRQSVRSDLRAAASELTMPKRKTKPKPGSLTMNKSTKETLSLSGNRRSLILDVSPSSSASNPSTSSSNVQAMHSLVAKY